MGKGKTKRQADKARKKQRLKVERNRTKSLGSQINQRVRDRVTSLKPRGWIDECAEDVAVFDLAARGRLTPELAVQAEQVGKALQLISDSLDDDAQDLLSEIPRSSPYSEWRIFVRGYILWVSGGDQTAAAEDVWRRMRPERRPFRIATALLAALRNDLDSVVDSLPVDFADSQAATTWPLDRDLLQGAKLLRRIRIGRHALRQAEYMTKQPEEDAELTVGPEKLRWIKEFGTEFRWSDPELVEALRKTALQRIYCQPFVDLFEDVTKSIPGPTYDPWNTLLTAHFESKLGGVRRSVRFFEKYLEQDLPRLNGISSVMKNAIASQIHLNLALATASTILPFDSSGFVLSGAQLRQRHFQSAIAAYPTHRVAHEEYVAWLRSRHNGFQSREPDQQELAAAMTAWSEALPQDSVPRLWLVEYLLELEDLEGAQRHVEWLRTARLDTPTVASAPWRFHLLQTMRLCRRKTSLGQAQVEFDIARQRWPKWLSTMWGDYLQCGIALRQGATDEFEHLANTARQSHGFAPDSVGHHCLLLGASQRMQVSGGELRPLREPVGKALSNLHALSTEDLMRVGSCFWDLHRTSFLYPAYKKHGKKLATELWSRLRKPAEYVRYRQTHDFTTAILWLSEHLDFHMMPQEMSDDSCERTSLAAAVVNSAILARDRTQILDVPEQIELLKSASVDEPDLFYRDWYGQLAESGQSKIDRFGDLRQMMSIFEGFLDDVDDDESGP